MSEPVRVLHILTVMGLGGAESRIMDLYRQIDTDRVQFDFIVHLSDAGYYDQEIMERGGRIYQWPRLLPHNIFRYLRETDRFFKAHKEYDIIHGHLISYGILYHLIAKKNGVRVRIVHARSSAAENNARGFLTSLMIWPLKYCATHYLACSVPAAEYVFGKRNLRRGKVKIINNAIDARKFLYSPEDRARIRQELGLMDRWVVGHVGRFRYAKNHPFLLEIFSEILKKREDATLLLVGEGQLKDDMILQAHRMGIGDKVVFAGERSDIPSLLSAMDIFIFPSHYEGLPGSVIEAQASGLRCFVSDAISREAGITDLISFISLKESSGAWAEQVIRAASYERKNMVEMIASAGFDVQRVAEELQQFYLQLAAKKEK